jgi:amino acid adenylation domain-containing protein
MPRIRGGMSLAEALATIDTDLAADLKHQRFPGDRLGQVIKRRRDAAGALYDIMINYVRGDYSFAIDSKPITCANLSSGFSVPWSIAASDFGPHQAIQLTIDYDPGRVSAREAEQLCRALRSMLFAATQSRALPIASLPLDQPGPRLGSLFQRHAQQAPPHPDATLPHLLVHQLARTPDRTALIHGTVHLTYRELHARADQLATHLTALGVTPGTIVGVLLPRTIDLLIALLAIHKAGGAYLPLDPEYPRHRLDFMLADSATTIVITDDRLALSITPHTVHIVIVPLAGVESQSAPAAPFEPRATPNDAAYLLYTSGSTGVPKGVIIKHVSVVNMLLSCRDLIQQDDLCRVLFATSINFDISVYEMFIPLAFGGSVVLVDDIFALAASSVRDEITLINTVPSLMQAYLASAELPLSLRVANLAGEALPRSLADAVFAACPDVRLFNMYGPTETTVLSTWSLVDSTSRQSPPIGHPIRNTSLYVVDDHGNPVPSGAIGELWIGGVGVAEGYLNRPELTDERFRANPFGEGRIFRTGDRVRFLPDGQLAYLGRADRQVKINGLRVEPGEIEAVCLKVPGISAAAVTTYQDAAGHRSLVAYLVCDTALDDTAVLSRLGESLPAHMVPRRIVWLDRVPLTANGKVDYAALPQPAATVPAAVHDSDVTDPIVGSFTTILQRQVGQDDDFFSQGGDSLAAIRLILELERTLSMPVPRGILHAGRTPRQVGRRLADLRAVRLRQLEPIRMGEPDAPTLFVLSGVNGTCHEVEPWIAAWPTEWTIYGVLDRAAVAPVDPASSMTELAEQAAEAILAAGRRGPCHLLGYSFGGRLAYETAVYLHANSHDVGFLGIVDTPTWIEDGFPVSPTNLIVQARRRSAANHRIPRCDVPLTFFRTSESWVDQPDDYFWSRTARQVDVIRLRGSHHTFGSGHRLPSLAQAFSQALDQRGLIPSRE